MIDQGSCDLIKAFSSECSEVTPWDATIKYGCKPYKERDPWIAGK